ncbi:O-mannosyltransferase [Rhizopus microsporus var. microsporus]|uniref:Dolichyl-phosphate-mannose--protein mannosyltransferase n=2 Tax=Rhizopus microsporus TaxID=58291 RepID=A0A2G4SGC2_RHIZD|nr:glycosyltransferase family 39 protein [Rhizopus microsporus ATCC 52813]ORE07517.1 O-mannosyltransferase [Rhizopus microsporus var. microsporus]PHZ07813.1 glycosyltransferase family 39 protein [Rhizopus microsporus ATCC 52813]
MSSNLRQRRVEAEIASTKHLDVDFDDSKKYGNNFSPVQNDRTFHKLAFSLLCIIATFVTFYKIWNPAEVVFDEVHFGKFAGYYLQRTYYFDVHPPLAKLMIAAVGYLLGFDGKYDFANIGDDYHDHNVPYIGLRSLPAALNVFSTALIYLIMKESGYSLIICVLSTAMYIFDNAMVTQNRLILLDSMLVFYMLATVYTYVRFRKLRHKSFSVKWWFWLLLTGIAMAMTVSVKMVGLFLVALIGLSVLYDLWNLLDINYGLTMKQFMKHFYARAFALIIVPIAVYLFWFYIHFAILDQSGPGDSFMSTRFQDTLKFSPLKMAALEVHYGDVITLKHKDTNAFLHSHDLHYPLRYEDGRVSSTGQQVTGVLESNENCFWRVKPTFPIEDNGEPVPVKNGDVIQLEHVVTGTNLLTHDVASPWMPTNEEITTVPLDSRYEETLFKIIFEDDDMDILETHMTPFRLIHEDTKVAVWVHNKKLPEWGLGHLEVNGNKNAVDNTNYWMAQEIKGKNATEINSRRNQKQLRHMPFIKKFLELQGKMISHNAGLTKPHPYQSTPITWPFMIRGVSYWSKEDTRSQIYLTGNLFGWYLSVGGIAVFAGIMVADILARRRGIEPIDEPVRHRLIQSAGFFFTAWALHYFPFFLMGRSLFLHHYLPAATLNYLLLGSMYQFIFIDGIDSPVSFITRLSNKTRLTIMKAEVSWKVYPVVFITLICQIAMFIYLAPLTYGTPMTLEEVQSHQILSGWKLQYAK